MTRLTMTSTDAKRRTLLGAGGAIAAIAALGTLAAPARAMKHASDDAHLGTFRYEYEGGGVYEFVVTSDEALNWEALEGDEQGATGEETVTRRAVSDSVHLVDWTEDDGSIVVHALDFEAGTVTVVYIYEGERIHMQGTFAKVG